MWGSNNVKIIKEYLAVELKAPAEQAAYTQ